MLPSRVRIVGVAAVLVAAAAALASAAPAEPAAAAALPNGDITRNFWAVLVAGSNGYSNYRHQSDVCNMYQLLHNRGVPDDHIIVFMYDDIASSSSNPLPGTIINRVDGPNVYAGVPRDYTGAAVTPSNFVTLLTGGTPSGGSGRRLQSTTSDRVFIFFSDHGGPGVLCFPSEDLGWQELQSALAAMHRNGLYGRLTFYIEACFAGSMFYRAQLPPNAYITTASPIAASSYASTWSSRVSAYLTNVWSNDNMQYMNGPAHDGSSLQSQFDYTCDNVGNYTTPCQYGDLAIASRYSLAQFFGAASSRLRDAAEHRRRLPADAVPAWDVSLATARRVHAEAPSAETAAVLLAEEMAHRAIDRVGEFIRAYLPPANGHATCLTCDSSCTCMRQCYDSQATCRLECCSTEACTRAPGNAANSVYEQRDQCIEGLAAALRGSCGRHEYINSLTPLLFNICRTRAGRAASHSLQLAISRECLRHSRSL